MRWQDAYNPSGICAFGSFRSSDLPSVETRAPRSFKEFVDLIESLHTAASGPLWYRGCGKSSYQLLPSLYRPKPEKKAAELALLEQELMTRFRQRSIPFHGRNLSDPWNALFFMQHYGIPTRLLD
jgi:hypothetical protein